MTTIVIFLQRLTSVTLKSRSNKKPGYFAMYPYQMYMFGDDPAIISGVTVLFVFSVLALW
jgi:hypothetical protein